MTKCTCGKREQNKCCLESETKTGKMCLKEYHTGTPLERLVSSINSGTVTFPSGLSRHQRRDCVSYAMKFIKEQESLGNEFQQVLDDNFWELVLK